MLYTEIFKGTAYKRIVLLVIEMIEKKNVILIPTSYVPTNMCNLYTL